MLGRQSSSRRTYRRYAPLQRFCVVRVVKYERADQPPAAFARQTRVEIDGRALDPMFCLYLKVRTIQVGGRRSEMQRAWHTRVWVVMSCAAWYLVAEPR